MKKLLLFGFMSLSVSLAFAQQNIVSSGNNSTSASGEVTYSIGLLNYKEALGSGGSSSVGAQIPLEVLQLLSTDEQNLVSLKVFPNPASDHVFINLTKQENLNYKLTDVSGRKIADGKISTLQTRIDLNYLNTSIYILNIYQNNNTLKSYKIIKK